MLKAAHQVKTCFQPNPRLRAGAMLTQSREHGTQHEADPRGGQLTNSAADLKSFLAMLEEDKPTFVPALLAQ